jgi:UDP-N-acetylmuramoylalanine--D-glutamate ligase
VVLFGHAAGIIETALSEASESSQIPRDDLPVIERRDSLEEAVIAARRLARSGDIVLLSPGGTSFDAFKDFTERGDFFKNLVAEFL